MHTQGFAARSSGCTVSITAGRLPWDASGVTMRVYPSGEDPEGTIGYARSASVLISSLCSSARALAGRINEYDRSGPVELRIHSRRAWGAPSEHRLPRVCFFAIRRHAMDLRPRWLRWHLRYFRNACTVSALQRSLCLDDVSRVCQSLGSSSLVSPRRLTKAELVERLQEARCGRIVLESLAG